ncbi:unnamed protein product [Mytilus coruscus]|uniref:Uncharacterized protein n=1 Tax=Mytilus coruscus TaxID=42192 RepID=A0A6J8CSF5_MYTCO|nr:unnamed protein product [Mytilus coruscus]
MTDRHIVNQSLKSLLEKMKIECLPTDDDTDMDLIKKMSAINGFKCNLHVLVNFATQAESGLKLWEQNILESVDCSSFFSPSCCDFIRASTKLCVPGADEKSGYGLLFKTFLNQLEPPVDLQLTTFHGHRINLLFSMGASVFHHRNHIKLFIENYFNKEDLNRLLCAVYNYVNNPVYLAGCRALERQLSDCLPGGIFNENTEGVNKDLRVESTTVATTNIVSERDFAYLDRLRREKPNANTIALEGIILFSNNKTLRWLDDMNVVKSGDVNVLPKDVSGRSWYVTNFEEVSEEYKKYAETYFS